MERRIVFEEGSTQRVAEELNGFSRVLIVTTRGRAPLAHAIGERLRGSAELTLLATAREHVPRETVAQARRVAEEMDADAVVAIGGGSAIGLAKALALETKAKPIAIPTTYSGSEMTSLWGVTDGSTKTTGRDERARPVLVIYDPALTLDLPREVTIASAWNAMAHAVEALYSRDAKPSTKDIAEEAVRAIGTALPRVLARPDDRTARHRLLEGAKLAGMAIDETTMGVHHKLCHVLGGRGLPHAATHAALLPHVARFNRTHAPAAMARVAAALGAPNDDGAAALVALARATGAPARIELPRAAIDEVVAAVLASPPANPRPLDEAGLRGLLEAASLDYLAGFGAALASEALRGALPKTQNTPRRGPYGLYAELVSGTPFTSERARNSRSWLYRIRPSTTHDAFAPLAHPRFTNAFESVMPNRIRWKPMPLPSGTQDFLDGLATLGGAGDPSAGGPGFAVHLYAASADMKDRSLANADGDVLVVPQEGALVVRTELGVLSVSPGEILLVPRGIRFSVALADGAARGWMCEAWGARFRLPERGPIGSNGLADERHFLAPVASYEEREAPHRVVTKLGGALFAATQARSPFDVVAWHGIHVPYKYDLSLFNAMGTVSFDHPDPSIHTVLTTPLDDHGRAIVDFVAFVGRWEVAEHTFRPPCFHRNAASEINGVVRVKSADNGYDPGCTFLTPLLAAHGVTTAGYEAVIAKSDAQADAPNRIPDESLWIMFESAMPFRTTRWAQSTDLVDATFDSLFADPKSHFGQARSGS
ncbi:MAG TPA: iron-containing alcohol dehydrogenase [Labilithrix sp.]